MDEDRERQMEMEAEDTAQDDVERDRSEISERTERSERVEPRTERRTDERVSENQSPVDTVGEHLEPLFEESAARKFRSRWQVIQGKFVDDPRASVKQADDLVADIIKNVTMTFADRRIGLEKQWNSGENVSTEDMRQALKRYRAFFERLLTLES
jgi:hypothetical protein